MRGNYTHIYTYILTHIHICMHTYLLHQYMHTYVQTYALTYIHTFVRTYTHSVRFPSMDQFSIIDKNKGMCCVEVQNKYCFKYRAVFSIRKPNFAYVTHQHMSEKNILLNFAICPVIALGCHEWTTQFP